MSKQTKIIIGVVAGVLVLCVVACVAVTLFTGVLGSLFAKNITENSSSDPAAVQVAASDIADFDLAPGYVAVTSVNIFNIKMVMYNGGGSDDRNLVLIEMPGSGEINETSMQELENAMRTQSGRQLQNVQVIETRDLTLRGSPAKMIVQEGNYSDNRAFRQALVAFKGKNGLAMMMVTGPTDTWDQAAVDAMVNSIR